MGTKDDFPSHENVYCRMSNSLPTENRFSPPFRERNCYNHLRKINIDDGLRFISWFSMWFFFKTNCTVSVWENRERKIEMKIEGWKELRGYVEWALFMIKLYQWKWCLEMNRKMDKWTISEIFPTKKYGKSQFWVENSSPSNHWKFSIVNFSTHVLFICVFDNDKNKVGKICVSSIEKGKKNGEKIFIWFVNLWKWKYINLENDIVKRITIIVNLYSFIW